MAFRDDISLAPSCYYEGESIGGSMTMLGGDTMRLTGCKLIACTSLEFTRL